MVLRQGTTPSFCALLGFSPMSRPPKATRTRPVDRAIIDAEVMDTRSSSALVARRPDGPSAQSTFSTWLASKHEKTIATYRGDMGDFAAWYLVEVFDDPDAAQATGVGVLQSDLERVLKDFLVMDKTTALDIGLRFRVWLEKARSLAPNTVNRKLAALRSYVKLARQLGVCSWDLEVANLEVELVRDVSGPGPTGYATLVTAAEGKIAAAALAEDDRLRRCWIRNLALLRLYHDAGMRRFEPLTADYPDDLDLRPGDARIRVRRKKRRVKAWIDVGSMRTVAAIQAWVAERGDAPGPLFTSMHVNYAGKRLTVRSINKMVDALGAKAGLEVTPHGLRHTAATTLLNKTNGNVRAVSEFLGHKGLGIVQQYDDDRQKQAKKMGALLDDDPEDT